MVVTNLELTELLKPLAKFRCGVAPIRVETGRYVNIPFHKRLHCM